MHWHRVSLQSFIIKTYKTHFFHGRKNIYVLDHAFVSSFVWDSTHETVKAENIALKTENERLKKLTHRVYEELAEFKRKH